MQIAAGNKLYILDMIKLYNAIPDALEDCITRIFQSPSILKLGKSNVLYIYMVTSDVCLNILGWLEANGSCTIHLLL